MSHAVVSASGVGGRGMHLAFRALADCAYSAYIVGWILHCWHLFPPHFRSRSASSLLMREPVRRERRKYDPGLPYCF